MLKNQLFQDSSCLRRSRLCGIVLLTIFIISPSGSSADSGRLAELETQLESANEKIYQKEMRIRNLLYERDRRANSGGGDDEQKDLIIRNLRRQIFDLESQMPSDSQERKLRQTIRRLKDELRDRQGDWQTENLTHINALEDQIQQLRSTIRSLESERSIQTDEQVQALNQRIEQSQSELTEKVQQLNKANELVTTVVAERTEAIEELKTLRASYQDLQTQIQTQMQNYQNATNELTQANTTLKDELAQLQTKSQQDLAEAQEQVQTLQEQQEQLLSDHEQLVSNLKEGKLLAEKELKDQIEKLGVYKRLIDKQDEELAELRIDLEQKTRLAETLSADAEEKIVELKASISKESELAINDITQKYDKQLQALKSDLQQKQELNSKLAADFETRLAAALEESKKKSADQVEYVKSEHQIEVKDLKSALQKLKQTATDERTRYESQLSEAKNEIETRMQTEISEYKNQLAEKGNQLTVLQNDLKKFQNQGEQHAQLQQKYKSDKSDWERKFATLESQRTSGQTELQEQLAVSNQEQSNLKEQIQQKQNEIDELTRSKNEVANRVDFLLAESAEQEKQIAAFQVQLKDRGSIKKVEKEIAAAEKLINGFREDVEAKTQEIIRMADEQTDLRAKLKQVMDENAVLKQQTKYAAQVQNDTTREQTNAIKTALSKAKQEIAQRDAEIAELQKRQLVLGREVEQLTRELNIKIKKIGELDLALLNNAKKYSPDQFERMKQPLISEISTLKKRVSELEMQLLESWDTAENMLIELKNHPNIKNSLETVVQTEN